MNNAKNTRAVAAPDSAKAFASILLKQVEETAKAMKIAQKMGILPR